MIAFTEVFSQNVAVRGPEAAVAEDIPPLAMIHGESRHDLMGRVGRADARLVRGGTPRIPGPGHGVAWVRRPL